MPSVRGAGALVAGIGCIVAGRLLGADELLLVGLGALVAVILGMAAVGLGRALVAVSRRINPPRTHAGEQVHISLEVQNRSPMPTSVLEITDSIEGLPRPATFSSRAIPPGRKAIASYALTCRGRGIYKVGPLTITVSDPFGLAKLTRRLDIGAELAVYPSIVALSELPRGSGHDVAYQSDRPAFHTPQGEEFYTLRDYQEGDDLRKVHWRSTARRGRIMIKQEQVPWHARGTVVLDVRLAAAGAAGSVPFEQAVVAAASAVQYFAERGEFCRFLSTDGHEMPLGFGLDHFRTIFGRLAVMEETTSDRFAPTVANLRGSESGGALIYCGGMMSDEEAHRLVSVRNRYSPIVAVRYPPSSATAELGRAREMEREARTDGLLRSGGVLVVRPGGHGLQAYWDNVISSARRLQKSRWSAGTR